jgi:hypothetical protein
MKSESSRYRGVLLLCIVLSVGWIIASAITNHPADGGRGGAIAVAVSLVVMFLSRGYGSKAFLARISSITSEEQLKGIEADTNAPDANARISALEQNVSAIVTAIRTSQDITDSSTRRQSWFLAISSGVGTIAWGFGDWAVQWAQMLFHLV